MIKNILVLFFFLLHTNLILAQASFQWTGTGGNSNWGNAGNWNIVSGSDLDGVPDSDDDAQIIASSGGQLFTVQVASNQSINNLTITASANFTAAQVTIVSGNTLLVNGVLSINNSGGFGASLVVDGIVGIGSSISTNGGVVTLNPGSTVSYIGTSNQSIRIMDYQNLEINKSGGTATLNGDITINGNFIHSSGTFSHIGGTVTFTGSSAVISGSATTRFLNLAFNGNTTNNGNVEVSSQGLVTLGNSAILDADGSGSGTFRLLSTSATNTAKILAIPAGSSITGNIIFERYMQDITPLVGSEDWRYLSSPIANTTVADIQSAKSQEYLITGSFSGASTCTGCTSSPSLLQYTEEELNTLSDGWFTNLIPSTSNTETLEIGRGYITWQRDENSPVTLELIGQVNQGNISLPVTFTDGGSGNPAANDGWNLVGNPYPAPVDWSNQSAWSYSNLTSSIYLRDNDGIYATTNNFITHNGTVGTPQAFTGIVAAGQAFWVKSFAANPSLTVTEDAKTSSTATFVRTAAPENVLRIKLIDDSEKAWWDETVVHFREDADDKYEEDIDAVKMENYTLNIATKSTDGTNLAINSVSTATLCHEIIINMYESNATGNYKLDFSGWETFTQISKIVLVDNYLGSSIEVTDDTNYSFEISDDPKTKGERFSLLVSKNPDQIIASSSNLNLCEGNDGEILIENPEAGVTYFANINGNIVSEGGSEGEALSLIIPSENLLENSTVDIYASTGCLNNWDMGVSISFIINDKPKPSIERLDEYTLVSNYEVGNQWYFNDEVIEGATNQELSILETGKYSLEVTNEHSCSSKVDMSFTVTGINDELEKFGVQVYPNPVDDFLIIDTKNYKNAHIFISTINGKLQQTKQLKKGINQIDVSNLEPGLYFLKIRNKNKDVVVRIIKK